MNIVGCDDLGALFLTIVTCVTVGATSVRPQRDRSLRKERPASVNHSVRQWPPLQKVDVADEFTCSAPRSYPGHPLLCTVCKFIGNIYLLQRC